MVSADPHEVYIGRNERRRTLHDIGKTISFDNDSLAPLSKCQHRGPYKGTYSIQKKQTMLGDLQIFATANSPVDNITIHVVLWKHILQDFLSILKNLEFESPSNGLKGAATLSLCIYT